MDKRRELIFQKHIIESYRSAGGAAEKWVDANAKGRLDLVASLTGFGAHLIEVKHRPNFGPNGTQQIKNPLTPRQKSEAKKYLNAGANVHAAVIGSSEEARGSFLAYFDPLADTFFASGVLWVPYELGKKFDVRKLLYDNWRRTDG